ncbi:P-loop containing nucleoside triphosphate hydrolase protein [Podospora conica]|nr:P-loop containing nucleoside triphosphate hydrolase protein [Schizothecium conicum]
MQGRRGIHPKPRGEGVGHSLRKPVGFVGETRPSSPIVYSLPKPPRAIARDKVNIMADRPADFIMAILGAPASGKGTLCKRLANDKRFAHNPPHHVSVGDLLRAMPSGPDINGHIAAGTVLPGDELVPILAAHIAGLPHPRATATSKNLKVVLLDGFPRSVEQEAIGRKPLASRGRGAEFPDIAFFFSCPKEVLKARYMARRRGVDDEALFEKRYEQHERESPGVLELYRERKILIEIDNSRGVNEAYGHFSRFLEMLLADD